jgi:hypothetical protein
MSLLIQFPVGLFGIVLAVHLALRQPGAVATQRAASSDFAQTMRITWSWRGFERCNRTMSIVVVPQASRTPYTQEIC